MAEVAFDWSTANPGSQRPFIEDTQHRHTAFVGGLGSGKSWSGAIKAVLYAIQHPNSLGLVCAPTYRQMRDSTLREFMKLLPNELIASWNKSEYELKLVNGSEILFRSLENYENVRGVEVAWIWIDEANLISYKAWRVCIGRLRQPGFPHRCWVTTTPRGKTLNWLYEEYVLKPSQKPELGRNRQTFHAKTRDNVANVGEEYVADLEATYTGEFAEQELLGQFVDIIEGRVYPEFERQYHVDFYGEEILHDPALPMYGMWDYGIGDAGALWVAQIKQIPEHLSIPYKEPGEEEAISRLVPAGPALFLVDLIMEEGENVDFWIDQTHLIEDTWGPFAGHWGDPAGEQRTATTGKSMAQHLREAKIYVRSKKVPNDEGRNIIHRLLTQRRLFVSSECALGAAAFTNFHWPLDPDGRRKPGSPKPVHDWSSHPMDAVRYGAVGLFPVLSASPFDKRNLNQVTGGPSGRAPRAKFSGIKGTTW